MKSQPDTDQSNGLTATGGSPLMKYFIMWDFPFQPKRKGDFEKMAKEEVYKKELIKGINRLAKDIEDISLLHLIYTLLRKSLAAEITIELDNERRR